MGLSVIPTGAEIRIKKELLEGYSVQEVASRMGLAYNSVALRYRKLVEQGEIEDRVKHPFRKRLPEDLHEFLNMKKGDYKEYPLSLKEDCEYTVAFLNGKCIRVSKSNRYGRFAHRWNYKIVGDFIRIIKTK